MDRIYRVTVDSLPGEMPAGYLLGDIADLGIHSVDRVERSAVYFLRGDLDDADVERLCHELLADPIVQRAPESVDKPMPVPGGGAGRGGPAARCDR